MVNIGNFMIQLCAIILLIKVRPASQAQQSSEPTHAREPKMVTSVYRFVEILRASLSRVDTDMLHL